MPCPYRSLLLLRCAPPAGRADPRRIPATQPVFDPRRLGQQTSGLSNEDIADIICLLLPYSEPARQEVRRIAAESTQHMVGRDDVDGIPLNYHLEDDSRNFTGLRSDVGEHHIALRFSSDVKDPSLGFTFGRHPQFADICLRNDPNRRLSKIHFRIYLNEWGVLMLEDMSTNGTVVDDVLLWKKDPKSPESRRTLESGSKIKILMHEPSGDFVFLVRIPNREGECAEAFKRNLDAYLARQNGYADANATIVPGPGGHVCDTSLSLLDRFVADHADRWIFSRRPRGILGQLLPVTTAPLHGDLMPSAKPDRATASQGRGTGRTSTTVCARLAGEPLPPYIRSPPSSPASPSRPRSLTSGSL